MFLIYDMTGINFSYYAVVTGDHELAYFLLMRVRFRAVSQEQVNNVQCHFAARLMVTPLRSAGVTAVERCW